MTPTQRPLAEFSAILGRWLLGGLFVYMGFSKALQADQFLKLIHEYRLVSSPLLLNSIAATLPWFEVFCGLLLLAGVAVRGTALILVAMLVPFTVAVLHRALGIASAKSLAFCAVEFDCGCGTGAVLICHKLIENCLLILLSCWLVAGYGRRLSLRFSLLRPTCT